MPGSRFPQQGVDEVGTLHQCRPHTRGISTTATDQIVGGAQLGLNITQCCVMLQHKPIDGLKSGVVNVEPVEITVKN